MHELTGCISNIAMSYATGKPLLTFEVNEDKSTLLNICEELRATEKLTIKIGKFSEKRSRDANSYYWSLLGKLCKALNISRPFCHNLMLRRYGVLEEFDGQTMFCVIPDTDEASKKADEAEKYHIKPTSSVREGNDGVMYRTYLMLKGSHEYTREEFSHLVNGLVDECKHMGIETATPDEIAKMMALYKEVGE